MEERLDTQNEDNVCIEEEIDIEDNTLVQYAKKELDVLLNRAKEDDEEAYRMQKMFNDGVVEVIKAFSKCGHSGFSADIAIHAITRLLKFQPLTPLTFEDEEWNEVTDGVFQNKRASNVFKQANKFNGEPYCLDGPNGETVSLKEYPLAYIEIFDREDDNNE